jgi:pSer/pThr/pTyr-binding forkhead associated (FHA) protein
LLTIGRSDSADIKIDGDYISRIHSRILRIGMDSVIEDADSKNGTRVNGEIIERHVLKHGDLIRVGTANFRFVDPAAGPADGE